MKTPSPLARDAAKRVWTQFHAAESGADGATAAAARAHSAMRIELQRWIGVDGYRTLYGRAQLLARAEHPEIDGIVDVEAATVSLLTHIVDLLSRLIGADIAIRLVDGIAAHGTGTSSGNGTGIGTTSQGELDG